MQRQPWPGCASKITLRPDHGETSCKGSGKLAGNKTLITGGDSGIGRAAVIAYAREGADAATNYLPAEEPDAREVIALIRAEGRRAVAIPGDLRDERSCGKLVEQAVSHLGGLNILVSNAARQQTWPGIADISSQDFDDTVKTNVYTPFRLTKAAVARMGAGALIVNISSEQAAAVLNFTKAMAKQLPPAGPRSNDIAIAGLCCCCTLPKTSNGDRGDNALTI